MKGVGYRDLVRALSLADGFVLMPVEVQGPDVARALATQLTEQGWPTVTLEPTSDAEWGELVARLLDAAATDARVVLVVGPRQPSGALYAALRLVNQRRDSIADALARPLLWAGPPDFLKLTWERAPDFWSIRALTRKLSTPPGPTHDAPLWPGAWVADPPERLRQMLASARRHGDEKNAARISATLAEALLARGDLDEAAEVVAEAPPSPELTIAGAVIAALRGDAARARATLEAAVGLEKELEGRRLVALGNLELASSPARAVELYERAAIVLRDAQDGANEAVAIADVGVAALADGALDVAAERLERALTLAREAGDARNEARILTKIGHVQLLERDSRRACATLEEAMARLADVGDPRAEAEVLRRLARAYLELGDPEKAEGDALRAADLARAARDDGGAAEAEAIAREARQEMTE